MNLQELMRKIEDIAGFEPDYHLDLPNILSFGWFPFKSPIEVSLLQPITAPEKMQGLLDQMSPTVFRVGHVCPFNDTMTILAIFEDEDEARLYAVQTVSPNGVTQRALPPTRYTVSKHAPIYSTTAMPQDVFESEVAKEIAVVDESTGTDALLRIEALENIAEAAREVKEPDKELFEALKALDAIDAGEDEDPDDEDDEEEETPPTPGSPAPAPASVSPAPPAPAPAPPSPPAPVPVPPAPPAPAPAPAPVLVTESGASG